MKKYNFDKKYKKDTVKDLLNFEEQNKNNYILEENNFNNDINENINYNNFKELNYYNQNNKSLNYKISDFNKRELNELDNQIKNYSNNFNIIREDDLISRKTIQDDLLNKISQRLILTNNNIKDNNYLENISKQWLQEFMLNQLDNPQLMNANFNNKIYYNHNINENYNDNLYENNFGDFNETINGNYYENY